MRPSARRARAVHAVVWTVWITWLVGATSPAGSAAEPASDAAPRASLILGERSLAVGVIGEVIVAVRTPVGHRVLPIVPPPLESAELVSSDTGLDEHPGGGWLQRTHLHVRPLAPGPLRWPALEVRIEAPDGETTRLTLPERDFEVASVMRGIDDDRSPFGFHEPAVQAGSDQRFVSGLLCGLVAGGTGTLGLLALLGLTRGRRAARTRQSSVTDSGANTESSASDAPSFAPARAVLESDPRLAATRAAMALRALASMRFRVDLRASTTEELRRARPGITSDADFADLIQLLERLDALRFPDRPITRDEVARQLDSGEPLVRRWTCAERRDR